MNLRIQLFYHTLLNQSSILTVAEFLTFVQYNKIKHMEDKMTLTLRLVTIDDYDQVPQGE
jgi:hypothetical protein